MIDAMIAIAAAGLISVGVIKGMDRLAKRIVENEKMVLSIIRQKGEASGLQIVDISKGHLGQGIHSTLRKLEDEGLLKSYIDIPARGGRPSIMYNLTQAGLRESLRHEIDVLQRTL